MAQQILIIGLGQFGMSLARTLSQKGAEVLAIDTKKHLVEEAAEFVAEAVILNGADESDLAHVKPSKRDIAICALGEESKEASIVCTALLRQMGAPLVIARSSDPMHSRILELVGAHEVINPEEEFGQRFASRLIFKDLITARPFGDEMQLVEIVVPKSMVGKLIEELDLASQLQIMVVAIRRGTQGALLQPYPQVRLLETDSIIIGTTDQSLSKLLRTLR